MTKQFLLTTAAILAFSASSFANDFNHFAAGDLVENYGLWVEGAFSKGKKDNYNLNPGYDFDMSSVTIGVDGGVEDKIGFAYSFVKNNIDHKSNLKDDVNLNLFTIYAQTDVSENMFTNGYVQFGVGEVEKTRSVGANNFTAKPDLKSISGKINLGYNLTPWQDLTITPTVGISQRGAQMASYTEKEAGGLTASKSEGARTSILAGMSVSDTRYYYSAAVEISPEIHFNYEYAFNRHNNNNFAIGFIDGLAPRLTTSDNSEKYVYNIGFSVDASFKDIYQMAIGYDFDTAKNFTGHTVIYKLRFNL